ncbi:MAG: hypothetical protein ACP5GJ_04470, partial [Nanopusillaceae archaeon]
MTKIIARRYKEGTHESTEYYYVLDQGVLRPLYKYAKKKYNDGYYEYYEIDENELKDKPIIVFDFSNNGNIYIKKYSIDDFDNGGHVNSNKGEEINPKDLCDKFELSHNAKIEYEEFKSKYIPIIREIKEYFGRIGVEPRFMGHATRTGEAYLYECPIGCLAEYRGTTRCLRNVKRWIYQLWIMKLIFEALNVKQFLKKGYESEPSISIEQGNPNPAAKVLTSYGVATFWFEFQPSEGYHGASLIIGRKISVRPDIVFIKGEI